MSADEVEAVIDDMAEAMDDQEQISQAIGREIGGGVDEVSPGPQLSHAIVSVHSLLSRVMSCGGPCRFDFLNFDLCNSCQSTAVVTADYALKFETLCIVPAAT